MISFVSRKSLIGLLTLVITAIICVFVFYQSNQRQPVVKQNVELTNQEDMVKEQEEPTVQDDIQDASQKKQPIISPEIGNSMEALTPSVAIVTPRRTLPLNEHSEQLSKENRQIVEKFINGIIKHMESIESLEFELILKDNYNPLVDMEGYISSNKIDTFSFKGSIVGQTVNVEINCEKDMAVISMQGPEVPGKAKKTGYAMPGAQENLGSFELLQNIWMTPLRKMQATDLFDTVSENTTIKDEHGNELDCTVFSGPQFKWVFESSSGRLLRTESKNSDQNTITKLIYDKESKYPKKIIISYPDGDDPNDDRTITIEHKNLKVIYKKEEV